jgi:hypothetical protein
MFMKKRKLTWVILFLFYCGISSCGKINLDLDANANKCNGNCTKVRLTGKVVDLSTNQGLKNIEVKAHYGKYKSTCIFCLSDNFETNTTTTTDALGNFNFDIDVVKADFNQTYKYAVTIYSNVNDEYISGNYVSFDKYEPFFSNIVLNKYKKTKLNIKFKRALLDTFSSYVAYHNFYDNINGAIIDPRNQNPDFVKLFSQNITDSIVETYTGANFWTKINSRKFSSTGIISDHTDSIFCNANTTNTITIRY